MSKKQLFNRLDSLFSKLEEEASPLPVEQQTQKSGWSWKCNPAGIYLSCSAEIEGCLGIPAEEAIGKSLFSFHVDEKDTKTFEEVFHSNNLPAKSPFPFLIHTVQLYRLRFSLRKAPG
jgi:hypothetical protein